MPVPATWLPYCGAAPDPEAILARWNWDPALLALLLVFGALAIRAPLSQRERSFALASLGMAFLLFVSPFCALTSALFAARSAHHVILTALLAPLVAMALGRAGAARLPGNLGFWTAASAVTLWLWHAPPLYAAALSSDALYWLMQATLGITALCFWISVLRSAQAPAISALLAYMVQMGLLGALLTFSTAPYYAPHALTTAAWGLSPLEDQQLAGLIMWVPGGLIYLAAALALMRRLLTEPREPATA